MKIREEVVSWAKYPLLETKGRMTEEEYALLNVLWTVPESEWYNLIENYAQFLAKANLSENMLVE